MNTATINNPTQSDPTEPSAPAGESEKATSAPGLSGIADTLVDQMPDVQEHAISEAGEQARAEAAIGPVDTDGNPFDAGIHKVSPDGTPTLSPKGKLIKKPGRKAGSTGAPRSTVGGQGNSVISQTATGPSASDVQRMQARQAGNAAANLLMTVGIITGGEEWQPRHDVQSGLNEKLMLEQAFGDYFCAKGITDIPPGFALTFAIFGYALPRLTMPKTQTRMGKAKGAIKKWWINRKLKKHGMKAEETEKREESK